MRIHQEVVVAEAALLDRTRIHTLEVGAEEGVAVVEAEQHIARQHILRRPSKDVPEEVEAEEGVAVVEARSNHSHGCRTIYSVSLVAEHSLTSDYYPWYLSIHPGSSLLHNMNHRSSR